jgi:hypothetical protein
MWEGGYFWSIILVVDVLRVKSSVVLKGLWALFLLTFPFSLRFVVFEEASYRFGNFNPWVTVFCYLPEVFLVLSFFISAGFSLIQLDGNLFSAGSQSRCIKLLSSCKPVGFLFLINILAISFWQGTGILGAVFVWRLVEAWMVYQLMRAEILPWRTVVQLLMASIIFQVALGAVQVAWNVDANVKGIAKLDLADGIKQVRAYGTFLHPNILAGFLLALLLSLWKSVHFKAHITLMVFAGAGLIFAHSRAAWMVLLGVVILDFVLRGLSASARKVVDHFLFAGLILANVFLFVGADRFAFTDASFQERAQQIQISQQMIRENPLGVGASGFTLAMEKSASLELKPWEFQPVHNVYFLVMNELGVQGLILFLILIVLAWFKLRPQFVPFFSVLLLASFDHFWLTSFTGIITLAVCLPLISPHHQKERLHSEKNWGNA